MLARLGSWWQNASKTLRTVIIVMFVALLVLFVVGVLGYIFNWDWVGLGPFVSPTHPKDSDFQRGKTLWDWLQLLIIPVVLAVGGYLLNNTTSRTEREIAKDKQSEDALQAYIDNMSELLLDKHLREFEFDEVRTIARVRTLRVLPRLDNERKRYIIQFLYEAKLIDKEKPIINLEEADLRKANLDKAQLKKASLIGAKLMEADLSGADLSGADLSGAKLNNASLREANLDGADLYQASLDGADLYGANLFGASLRDAKLIRAKLAGAELYNADLTVASLVEADLSGASLVEANLIEASLNGVDLTRANLTRAKVTDEQLEKAKSLKGATMPDGTKHA